MTVHIIHANAGNDTNGNPRRAFIVLGDFGRRVFDEGYKGEQAVPQSIRDANAHGGTWTNLSITPGQYRALQQDAQRLAASDQSGPFGKYENRSHTAQGVVHDKPGEN